jgi:hypothetical protein
MQLSSFITTLNPKGWQDYWESPDIGSDAKIRLQLEKTAGATAKAC